MRISFCFCQFEIKQVKTVMKRFFSDLKKFGDYITYAARSELKAEVAGSFLNWLWWFLDPLLYMLVYSFIALLVFKTGEPHFSVFVFIGLNVWHFFSKTIKISVRLVALNKNIVTKVYIPKHMFVLSKMCVLAFKMFVSFGLTAIFLICDGVFKDPVHISYKILYVIPLFALLFVVTFAVSLFIMHFGVFIEDLNNVISVVLQLGFYASGIFYSIENRLKDGATWVAKILTNVNPVAMIMADMRSVIIGGDNIHLLSFAIWSVIAVVAAYFGIKLIYKFENSYVKII